MEALVAFIAKYWLNFILTLAGASVTAIIVKIKDRYKLGKEIQEKKPLETFKEEILDTLENFKKEVLDTVAINENNILNLIKQKEEKFTEAIDKEDATIQGYKEVYENIDNKREEDKILYQKGILYILKRSYFEDCEALLEPHHYITFEEFTDISSDHDLYNSFGGNHQGDILFKAIEEKYHKQT